MATSHEVRSPRPWWIRPALWAFAAIPFWLAMMTVHEAGHALHAWFSGGRVREVTLPFPGFSQTVVDPNPQPLIVAWGGPLWGVLVPLLVTLICYTMRIPGIGAWSDVGDAGDLHRDGTPRWLISAIGLLLLASGLWLWHCLGRRRPAAAASTILDTSAPARGHS